MPPRVNVYICLSIVVEVSARSVNAGHERVVDTALDELELLIRCLTWRGREPFGTQANAKECLVAAKIRRLFIVLRSGCWLPVWVRSLRQRTRLVRRNDVGPHLGKNVDHDAMLGICNVYSFLDNLFTDNIRNQGYAALVPAAVQVDRVVPGYIRSERYIQNRGQRVGVRELRVTPERDIQAPYPTLFRNPPVAFTVRVVAHILDYQRGG